MVDAPAVDAPAVLAALTRDGIAVVRGLLPVARCAELLGVVRELAADPGPFHRRLTADGGPALYSDLFRFRDHPAIAELVRTGPVAELACGLFGGAAVVMEDQWFLSEAGSATPSPWHQDDPYHPLDRWFVTVWLPLTPPPPGTTLRGVRGSHLRATYAPVEFSATEATLGGPGQRLDPVPDVDADPATHPVLDPLIGPGDAVLLDSRTLHAAGGFCDADFVRLSIRFAHPDTRYRARPWAVASFWDDHHWVDGQRLASEMFPLVTA